MWLTKKNASSQRANYYTYTKGSNRGVLNQAAYNTDILAWKGRERDLTIQQREREELLTTL